MFFEQMRKWCAGRDKKWIVAYMALLMLPWGLIVSRVLAEASVAVLGILFLVHSLQLREWKWVKDPVVAIGLVAWCWLLLTSLFSSDVTASLGVAALWIRYLLLYASLRHWVLVDEDAVILLGKILVVMMFFLIVDTCWQYVTGVSLTGHVLETGSGRLTGPMSNVKVGIFIAKMLAPTMGISIFFAIRHKHSWSVMGSVLLLLAAVATIVVSGERTAFASVMIAILAVAGIMMVSGAKMRRYALGFVLMIQLTVIALWTTQSWVQLRALEFYRIISSFPASEYGQLMKAGIMMGTSHPFFGVGTKGFRVLCPDLLADGQITTCNLHPHNIYVEWFAGAGVIGALLLIAMVGCLFYRAIRVMLLQREYALLLPAFTIACLIINFFPFMPTQSNFSNWPAILLWYTVSVSMASLNILQAKKNS